MVHEYLVNLNEHLQAGSQSTALLYVLCGLMAATCAILLPALFSRLRSEKPDYVGIYGWSLMLFSGLSLLLNGLGGLMTVVYGGKGGAGVQPFYPWRDLTLKLLPRERGGSGASSGSQWTPPSGWEDQWYVESFTVVVGGIFILLLIGCSVFSWLMLNGEASDREAWGRDTEGRLRPWLKSMSAVFIISLSILSLYGLYQTPVFRGASQSYYPVPMALVLMAFGVIGLLIGCLLAALAEADEVVTTQRPKTKDVGEPLSLERTSWEQHMLGHGFILDRPIRASDGNVVVSPIGFASIDAVTSEDEAVIVSTEDEEGAGPIEDVIIADSPTQESIPQIVTAEVGNGNDGMGELSKSDENTEQLASQEVHQDTPWWSFKTDESERLDGRDEEQRPLLEGSTGQAPETETEDSLPFGSAYSPAPNEDEENRFVVLDSKEREFYWPHQRMFIELVLRAEHREANLGHRGDMKRSTMGCCYLMHVAHTAGKSTAVFETAARLFQLKSQYSLIVYPDQAQAEHAALRFQKMLRQARRAQNLRAQIAGDVPHQPSPHIYFASADWIAETLLHQHAEFGTFLEKVGLIVFEDIERLSGIRATNLSIVNRRLLRILASTPYERRPVLAQTTSVNPTEATGAAEYAKALAGPYKVEELAIRDDAPRKKSYLYRLRQSPGLVDAQGEDRLPQLLQVGWSSFVFMRKLLSDLTRSDDVSTAVDVRASETVTDSDLTPPQWVDQQAGASDYLTLRPREVGWQLHATSADAWLSCHEIRLEGFFSLPEQVKHGGINRHNWHGRDVTDHLVCLVPTLRCRGLIRYLTDQWMLSVVEVENGDTIPTTVWAEELRPMGSRLVCGEPSPELLKKHVRASLHERQATWEELQNIFPRDWRLDSVKRQLETEGVLRRSSERDLSVGGRGEVEVKERDYLSVTKRDNEDLRTPLDAVGSRVAFLVETAGRQARQLRAFDREQLLRFAYPGKLFVHDRVRYRIVADEFAYAFEQYQRVKRELVPTSEHTIWVQCRVEDLLAYTEPVVERSNFTIEHSRAGWFETATAGVAPDDVAPILQYHEEGGFAFQQTRVNVTFSHQHHGYYEYTDSGFDEQLERTFVRWIGHSLNHDMACSGLLVTLPEELTVSHAALVTLRRMLSVAVFALVQTELDTIEVEAVPRSVVSESLGLPSSGAILLLDPYEGSTGIFESLGPDRRRFIINWFRLVWRWSADLTVRWKTVPDDYPFWDDIGTLSIRYSDNDITKPAVEEVKALLEGILGHRKQRTKGPSSFEL